MINVQYSCSLSKVYVHLAFIKDKSIKKSHSGVHTLKNVDKGLIAVMLDKDMDYELSGFFL